MPQCVLCTSGTRTRKSACISLTPFVIAVLDYTDARGVDAKQGRGAQDIGHFPFGIFHFPFNYYHGPMF